MKAEQTECIRVYLRYQSDDDRELQRRMRVDVMRGRAKSAIARDALRAYYFPPAPEPAPEIAALTQQVHDLARLVSALSRQVNELHHALAGLDEVRAQNAQLQTLLLAATFGDRSMKRAAAEVAQTLATGAQGNGHAVK